MILRGKCSSGCNCLRHTNSGNPHPVGTAGMEPWNKGKRGVSAITSARMSQSKQRLLAEGWRPSGFANHCHREETKERIGLANQGRIVTDETRLKISVGKKGNSFWTEDHHLNHQVARTQSEYKYPRGSAHPNYRGVMFSYFNNGSALLREWRRLVFERDNWTCQLCGVRGGVELNADHIVPKWKNIVLVFVVANGRTLCRDCHVQTDTFGGKAPRRPKEFQLPLPMLVV